MQPGSSSNVPSGISMNVVLQRADDLKDLHEQMWEAENRGLSHYMNKKMTPITRFVVDYDAGPELVSMPHHQSFSIDDDGDDCDEFDDENNNNNGNRPTTTTVLKHIQS